MKFNQYLLQFENCQWSFGDLCGDAIRDLGRNFSKEELSEAIPDNSAAAKTMKRLKVCYDKYDRLNDLKDEWITIRETEMDDLFNLNKWNETLMKFANNKGAVSDLDLAIIRDLIGDRRMQPVYSFGGIIGRV